MIIQITGYDCALWILIFNFRLLGLHIFRSLCWKVHQLDKSIPPPVMAVVTSMSYVSHLDFILQYMWRLNSSLQPTSGVYFDLHPPFNSFLATNLWNFPFIILSLIYQKSATPTFNQLYAMQYDFTSLFNFFLQNMGTQIPSSTFLPWSRQTNTLCELNIFTIMSLSR